MLLKEEIEGMGEFELQGEGKFRLFEEFSYRNSCFSVVLSYICERNVFDIFDFLHFKQFQ